MHLCNWCGLGSHPGPCVGERSLCNDSRRNRRLCVVSARSVRNASRQCAKIRWRSVPRSGFRPLWVRETDGTVPGRISASGAQVRSLAIGIPQIAGFRTGGPDRSADLRKFARPRTFVCRVRVPRRICRERGPLRHLTEPGRLPRTNCGPERGYRTRTDLRA